MTRTAHRPKPGTVLAAVENLRVGEVARIETSLGDYQRVERQLALPECERPLTMRNRRYLTRLCREIPVDGLGPVQIVIRITRVDDAMQEDAACGVSPGAGS